MINMISFDREYYAIKDEINRAIQNVMDSAFYILGKEVKKFEEEFAHYVGAKHAVGVNSGTDALLISLMALGVKSGDEVITVAHTTTPTAMAIVLSGARPVFVDIVPETYTLDVSLIERKITKKTKAIIAVHLYGNPVDMDPLVNIVKRHGIHIIEDVCQAHGAEYNEKKTGSFGILSAFSFYPTKNLGGYGDGGAVLTNETKLYDKIIMLRQYGWKNRYDSEIVGINSRLDEIQAAILRVKLNYLDRWNQRRIDIAGQYIDQLKDTGIIIPQKLNCSKHVYHQFVIRHNHRDMLQQHLLENEIQTQIHYPIPVNKQKTFIKFGAKNNLPVTEKICSEILSLPINPWVSDDEIKKIAETIITAIC